MPLAVGDTIAAGALPLAIAVALLAGLVSFASPCVLPLVPGFLGYVTGLSDVELAHRSRGRMLLGALLFVLGFTAVFVLTSIFLATAGRALVLHREVLTKVGGIVVIAMGALFLVGSGRGAQIGWRPRAGLTGAPVLGAVFGLGWVPCTSPALGAVLALSAAVEPSNGRAVTLTIAYCLGLGLPFLIFAASIERFARVSRWLSAHHRAIRTFGGTVLIVVGLLLVTGLWEQLTRWLQTSLVSGYVVPI